MAFLGEFPSISSAKTAETAHLTVTFLTPVGNQAARKTHTLLHKTDGTAVVKTAAYDLAKHFTASLETIPDIEYLHTVLTRRTAKNCFAIRGAAKHGGRINKRKNGDGASISDVPSRLIPVDLDKIPFPAHLDDSNILAVGDWLRSQLPEFQNTSCVVQLSASAGLSPWRPGLSGTVSARLWFLNKTPIGEQELKRFFKAANERNPVKIDAQCAVCCQPIYTATPIFVGMDDPVKQRFALLLGDDDECDLVIPPIEEKRKFSDLSDKSNPPIQRGSIPQDNSCLALPVAMIRHAAGNGEARYPVILKAARLAGGFVASGAADKQDALNRLIQAALESGTSCDAVVVVTAALDYGMQTPIAPIAQRSKPVECTIPLSEKSNLAADLRLLERALPGHQRSLAIKILHRYIRQSPVKRDRAEFIASLLMYITDPSPELAAELNRLGKWHERKARRSALKNSTAMILKRVSSVDEALRLARESRGLVLIKAPLGAGKTTGILAPIAAEYAGSGAVVAITNRTSLACDLSVRLNLANYQTIGRHDVAVTTALAICLPSTVNPKFGDVLYRARCILIDEIGAVVRECHQPHSAILKKSGGAKAVWERLIGLIKQSEVAIGVDADLSDADIQALQRSLQSPITVIEVIGEPIKRTAKIGGMKVVYADIQMALEAGEKIRIATDSAAQVRKLEKLVKRVAPNLRCVAIHQKLGLATTGGERVKRLLADINANIGDVDVLIHSPSIETGLSLQHAHFEQTFGLYCGVVSASQFLQMMARDRTASHYTIGIVGTGYQDDETSAAKLLKNLGDAHCRDIEVSDDNGIYTYCYTAATAWDERAIGYMADTHDERNQYAASLWYLLESRQFEVTRFDDNAVKIGRETLADLKRETELDYVTALAMAADIDASRVEELNQAYSVSEEESAELARFAMREELAIDEPSDADFEMWDEGKIVAPLKRLEIAVNPDFVKELTLHEVESVNPQSSRRFFMAQHAAFNALFEAAGIDLLTGRGVVTADSAMAAFVAMRDSEHRAVLEHCRVARFARSPKYPARWIGECLKKFGMAWSDGGEQAERTYAIDLMRHAAVMAIVERRRVSRCDKR